MAGFNSNTCLCTNIQVDANPIGAGSFNADGQLLIGATAAPYMRIGTLASTNSTITITNGAGSINLDVTAPLMPAYGGTGIVSPTQYSLLVAQGASAMATVAPSATSGVPLISQGAASNPIYGTAVVAGGGTGSTSFNARGIVVAGATSTTALSSVVLTNGQLLIGSTGAAAVASTITAGSGISVTNGAGSITIAAVDPIVTEFDADSGTATPSSGVINILGNSGDGMSTVASGNTVTIELATATTSQQGGVILASNAQAIAGTDSSNAVTSAALGAKLGTQTQYALPVGAGSSSAIGWLGPLTNGQLLIGSTGANPSVASLTAGSGISITPGAGSITIAAADPVSVQFDADSGSAVPSGGILQLLGTSVQGISSSATGNAVTFTMADATTTQKGVMELATNSEAIAGTDTNNAVTSAALGAKLGTQTNHGVMLGAGTSSALGVTAVGATNQVLLGNTGADPSWGQVPNAALANSTITVTAGPGISVTGSPVALGGSITISNTGAGPGWSNIGASQTLAVDNGYFCSSGGALSLALPASSAVGDEIEVILAGSTSWTITCGAGQSIKFGSATTTSGGTLASTAQGDSIRMVCQTANLTWYAASFVGNLSYT